jgi:hypothetical protein
LCKKVNPINGACGGTLNTCLNGTTFSDVADTTTQSNWSCVGIPGTCPATAASTAPCSLCKKVNPVNPVCGLGYKSCPNTILGTGSSKLTMDGIEYDWTCVGVPGTCPATASTPVNIGCTSTVCPDTLAVNGVCGTDKETCLNTGMEITGIGTTLVPGKGIYDLWNCGGIDGISITCIDRLASGVGCSYLTCKSVDGANNFCGNSLNTCAGLPSTNERIDDPVYFYWDCPGGPADSCGGSAGVGETNCKVDKSQNTWFQSQKGSVLAKGTVKNDVPASCPPATSCRTVLELSGIVASGENINSPLSDADNTRNFIPKNLVMNQYNYDYFYKKYFTDRNVGVTFTVDEDWTTNFGDSIGNTGVVFVKGDLTIKNDIDTNGFLMLIASGTITIENNVDTVNAMLVADKIEALGDGNQLTINGLVYGNQSVRLVRNMGSLNKASPGVLVTYNPNLIFNLPKEVNKKIVKWSID